MLPTYTVKARTFRIQYPLPFVQSYTFTTVAGFVVAFLTVDTHALSRVSVRTLFVG